MSSQPETRLQVRIVDALRARNVYAVRQRLEGRKGWPDLYLVLPCCGRAAHLEIKRPGRSLDPLQARTLYELQAAGAEAGVARSVEDAIRFVEGHQCAPDLPGNAFPEGEE